MIDLVVTAWLNFELRMSHMFVESAHVLNEYQWIESLMKLLQCFHSNKMAPGEWTSALSNLLSFCRSDEEVAVEVPGGLAMG